MFDSLPPGAGLAPMAGVSDAATRLLSFEQGASWAVSEMLSAKGYIYSNGNHPTVREQLTRFPGEGLAGLQLFGRDPHCIAEAAKRLEGAGFQFIDLNFGCPAPKITGNGEGSALMKEPAQLEAVVRAAAKATALPVTVKIRSGWDGAHVNAVEIACRCEAAGAAGIAVHARTRDQFYSGTADWPVIAAVVRAVKIPVFGNGDVRSGADAVRMLSETGCARIMVGRAAEGNPWIFAEIRAALAGEPYISPSFKERMRMAQRHLDLALALYGEKKGVLEMRKHVAWYIAGIPGAAILRARVNKLNTAQAVRALLKDSEEER